MAHDESVNIARKLLDTDDAMVWAETFCEVVGRGGVLIDEGLMVGWFANAIETAKRLDPEHDRLVEVLRYIATLCNHVCDDPNVNDWESHISEPTTGGHRYCGPCHAWRTLNGSPDAV